MMTLLFGGGSHRFPKEVGPPLSWSERLIGIGIILVLYFVVIYWGTRIEKRKKSKE